MGLFTGSASLWQQDRIGVSSVVSSLFTIDNKDGQVFPRLRRRGNSAFFSSQQQQQTNEEINMDEREHRGDTETLASFCIGSFGSGDEKRIGRESESGRRNAGVDVIQRCRQGGNANARASSSVMVVDEAAIDQVVERVRRRRLGIKQHRQQQQQSRRIKFDALRSLLALLLVPHLFLSLASFLDVGDDRRPLALFAAEARALPPLGRRGGGSSGGSRGFPIFDDDVVFAISQEDGRVAGGKAMRRMEGPRIGKVVELAEEVEQQLQEEEEEEDNTKPKTLKIVFEQAGQAKELKAQQGTDMEKEEEVADEVVPPPSGRWGQTATFLPEHNIILFVGGQTGKGGNITNDVFALDVSRMTAAAGSKQKSNGSSRALATAAMVAAAAGTPTWEENQWIRLSSVGLPPHAFAASTVTGSTNGEGVAGEKLWIIGGVTQDCQRDAPAYYWSAPSGDFRKGFWSNVTVDEGAPMRRRGAKAVQLATSITSSSSSSSSTSSTTTMSSSHSGNGTSLSVNSVSGPNGTTVMVVGGTADSSVCFTVQGDKQSADYPGIDLWTTTASTGSSSVEAAKSSASASSVRSFALDDSMHTLPLFDYSTVLIPADKTADAAASDKVVFIGGKNQQGKLDQLRNLWVLDVDSGEWKRWATTGAIPPGRMGHSSVLTSDGRIVVHGGYLVDPSSSSSSAGPTSPTNEVFVLDPHDASGVPTWSKADVSKHSATAPARAYHSSVMAGDVMVVAFGQASHGEAAGTRIAKASTSNDGNDGGAAATASQPAVHYLNIGAGSKGWSWSSAKADVASPAAAAALAAQASAAQQASAASSNSQQVPAVQAQEAPSQQTSAQSTASNVVTASSEAASPSDAAVASSAAQISQDASRKDAGKQEAKAGDATTTTSADAQKGSEAAAPASDSTSAANEEEPVADASKDASDTDANVVAAAADPLATSPPAEAAVPENPESGSTTSSSSSHSGAIAGSVLGAAAVAAAIGGLYAYRKRREAQAYALGQAQTSSSSSADDFAAGGRGSRGGDDDNANVHTMRNVGSRGPPVSNLWLHQPAAWATAAGKGLRRAASSASVLSLGAQWKKGGAVAATERDRDAESIQVGIGAASSLSPGSSRGVRSPLYGDDNEVESPYTTPASKGAFQVLRNFRGNGSGKLASRAFSPKGNNGTTELPDAFISSLAADDSPYVFAKQQQAAATATTEMRNASPSAQARRAGQALAVPAAAVAVAMEGEGAYALHHRNVSVDSLGSTSSFGSASHFSYPFLSAMHRPSLANMSHGAASSSSDGVAVRGVVGSLAPSAGSSSSNHDGGVYNPPTLSAAATAAVAAGMVTSPSTVGATIAALNLSPRDVAALAHLANPHLTPPSQAAAAALTPDEVQRHMALLALGSQRTDDLDTTVSVDGASAFDAAPSRPFASRRRVEEEAGCASPLFPWQSVEEAKASPLMPRQPPRARLTETSAWTLARKRSVVGGVKASTPAAGQGTFVTVDMEQQQQQRGKVTIDEGLVVLAHGEGEEEEVILSSIRGSKADAAVARMRSSMRAKRQAEFRIANLA